jgi:copper resistance protein B
MTRLALAVLLVLVWPSAALAQDPAPPADPHSGGDHAGHDQMPDQQPQHEHPTHDERLSTGTLPDFIPPLTDADRQAAFPDVQGHSLHDEAVHSLVLFDQLEWLTGDGASAFNWDNKGWVGGDRDRIWFRTEGAAAESDLEHAEAQIFYGRAIATWWDVLVGVRQDFGPGPDRTWAALGLQGLAPYWFEVEATAYVGESGRTAFRVETEYELLLTNRLVAQPLVEFELYGKDDPERGIGAGFSSGELGLRLRYEVRREIAPYVGVLWERKFFGTADLARAAGERTDGARLLLGIRGWF